MWNVWQNLKQKRKMRYVCMIVACENIRFSSLFAAGDVSRNVPAAKSEEKRMFSQASMIVVTVHFRDL